MPEPVDLLWEVGCEELPAWACDQVLAQLAPLLQEELDGERLSVGEDVSVVVGPRRFAATTRIKPAQESQVVERRGPAYEAAFEGDTPTRACEGFARSAGVTPDQLEVREDENGRRFVYAVTTTDSREAREVFPEIADRVVRRLNFGKAMRWGWGSDRFVRPIRWVVTLLGDEAPRYDLLGVPSGDTTRTHRFLGEARDVGVPSPARYVETLEAHHVIASHVERRRRIDEALDEAASAAGGEWYDPGGVLREVVHLVEFPTVITGSFDERYLELPARVLVTAMQSHQRYLPVRGHDGKLLPVFLTVMNGDPQAVDTIRPGYERVLEGRLDDAVFSFERDRSRGLDDMASALHTVVFHAKAGSLADRTARIRAVATNLASQLGLPSLAVDEAARLAKADQVSVLVQEFAELEGFAGSRYAADAGYDDAVCRAIDQQFLPRGANSPLPEEGVPAVLALADKVDLLVTGFAIGEEPTGSRDPHGLRRAAIGIVRIVLEHDLHVTIDEMLGAAAAAVSSQGFGDTGEDLVPRIRTFLDDRIEKHLTEQGVRVDAVRAARAASLPQAQHTVGLARALDGAVGSGDTAFASVLTAYTRCNRILAKSGDSSPAQRVDESLLEAPAERAVRDQLVQIAAPLAQAVESRAFDRAVEIAATLSESVDAFFDRDGGVMVMADDEALRSNRLALVAEVVATLRVLGDLEQLQV